MNAPSVPSSSSALAPAPGLKCILGLFSYLSSSHLGKCKDKPYQGLVFLFLSFWEGASFKLLLDQRVRETS